MQADSLSYRFVKEYCIQFGKALYLSGELTVLGQWNTLEAKRMKNEVLNYWIEVVQIPIDSQFEFKYFIGPYELNESNCSSVEWIGNANSKLRIIAQNAKNFSAQNDKQLKIMSFNIRFQNIKDKDKYHWTNRRSNCVQLILSNLPDVIGVQEPKKRQREFIYQNLQQFYRYYGKARDLHEDEQSGIFIRRDKFMVIEDGYVWINQNRVPAQVGFQARLPRYFTYLVTRLAANQNILYVFVNTHLDHESEKARLFGIKYMSETFQHLMQKYGLGLKNFFVTGDFNTSDKNAIFKQLKAGTAHLQSTRYVLPQQQSDFNQTFNGFSSMLYVAERVAQFLSISSMAIIDHIFMLTQDYKPIKFEVINKNDKIYSDHYPIQAKFLLKQQ